MISLFKQVIQAVNSLSDEKNAAHKRFAIKTAKQSGKPFIQACFHVLLISVLGQVAQLLVCFLAIIISVLLANFFGIQTDSIRFSLSVIVSYFCLLSIPEVLCTLGQVLSLTVEDLES